MSVAAIQHVGDLKRIGPNPTTEQAIQKSEKVVLALLEIGKEIRKVDLQKAAINKRLHEINRTISWMKKDEILPNFLRIEQDEIRKLLEKERYLSAQRADLKLQQANLQKLLVSKLDLRIPTAAPPIAANYSDFGWAGYH